MPDRIKNYKDFYPYYLSQHSKMLTKLFHFAGVLLVIFVIFFVIWSGKERFFWYLPIFGFGLSAFSHYVFEKNVPTTFKYPLWTLISDFRMSFELVTGKLKFK